MVIPSPGLNSAAASASLFYIYAVVVLCHIVACQAWFKRAPNRLPGPVLSASYCSVLMLALVLAPKSGQAFIYFQF
jgi:hypothetical protein